MGQSHNITAYYQRSCDLFLWGVEIPEEVWQPVSVSSVRDRYADLDHATIHEAIIPGYMLPSLLPAPYLSKEKVSFLGITQVTKRCGCQYIFRARFQGEGEMGTSDARSVRMSNIMIMAPIPIRGGTTQLGTNIPPIKPGYSPNEHVVSYEYGEGATLDVALVYRKFGKPKGIVRGLIRYNHHSAPEKLQSLIARTTRLHCKIKVCVSVENLPLIYMPPSYGMGGGPSFPGILTEETVEDAVIVEEALDGSIEETDFARQRRYPLFHHTPELPFEICFPIESFPVTGKRICAHVSYYIEIEQLRIKAPLVVIEE